MCIICRKQHLLDPGLTMLDVSGCVRLTRITKLPTSLKSLNCDGCTSLISFPKVFPDTLLKLSCKGCTSLTKIPNLPRYADVLDCSGCTKLTMLGSKMPHCIHSIFCKGCTALVALFKIYPHHHSGWLKDLNCSGCTSLRHLPDVCTVFSGLKFFNCSGCTQLNINTVHTDISQKRYIRDMRFNLIDISVWDDMTYFDCSGCESISSNFETCIKIQNPQWRVFKYDGCPFVKPKSRINQLQNLATSIKTKEDQVWLMMCKGLYPQSESDMQGLCPDVLIHIRDQYYTNDNWIDKYKDEIEAMGISVRAFKTFMKDRSDLLNKDTTI
jgi:hypothetical protein